LERGDSSAVGRGRAAGPTTTNSTGKLLGKTNINEKRINTQLAKDTIMK
jgi:hypothetical protein